MRRGRRGLDARGGSKLQPDKSAAVLLPRIYYTVHAQVFPGPVTLVKWWDNAGEGYAWSNLDFNELIGFHEFEKGGKRFVFQMFVGRGGAGELARLTAVGNDKGLTGPPIFEREQPGFQVLSDGTVGAAGADLVLGFHEIYASREVDLKAAVVARAQNAVLRRQEEARPKPKEDLVIRYRAPLVPAPLPVPKVLISPAE